MTQYEYVHTCGQTYPFTGPKIRFEPCSKCGKLMGRVMLINGRRTNSTIGIQVVA